MIRLGREVVIIQFLVFGKLVMEAPLSFNFSHFLASQIPYENDNSEAEWLNPLLP